MWQTVHRAWQLLLGGGLGFEWNSLNVLVFARASFRALAILREIIYHAVNLEAFKSSVPLGSCTLLTISLESYSARKLVRAKIDTFKVYYGVFVFCCLWLGG